MSTNDAAAARTKTNTDTQATDEPRLFGTDGIRGPAGEAPLNRDTVVSLAVALGRSLAETEGSPVVVLGGDTRESTEEICGWVAAGLAAAGVDSRYLGVVPTPAVAWAAREIGAAAGVAVSASHNPMPDNGVKLLTGEGTKWETAAEAAVERRMEPAPADLPHVELVPDRTAVDGYLAHLAKGLESARSGGEGAGPAETPSPFAGLKIALDSANGAAAPYAERLFTGLGADVVSMCDDPDGRNINQGCGSTHPERLRELVTAEGCDLGFAFDGDADRCLLVDEAGELRDGDAILYLWARALAADGHLDPPAIVATSMSNLGLETALKEEGIDVVRCGVGDRQVVNTLVDENLVLGGEQSGHIVNRRQSTTGDGLLTAIHLARIVAGGGRPVSELLAGFRRFPQVLVNVRVASKPDFDTLPAVTEAARRVEEELGETGRLVLRYSGTEPLARVMIEGPDQEEIDDLAQGLAGVISNELGGEGA